MHLYKSYISTKHNSTTKNQKNIADIKENVHNNTLAAGIYQ